MRISDWSSDVCASDLVETERLDGGEHGAQVAAVVAAGYGDVAGVDDELVASMQCVTAHVPAVRAAEPAHLAVGKRKRGQARIVRVEHGDARPGFCQQGQLVLDVSQLSAVPVQVRSEEHTSELQSLRRISIDD